MNRSGRLPIARQSPLLLTLLLMLPLFVAYPEEKPALVRVWDYHIHDKKLRQQAFKQFSKKTPRSRSSTPRR